MGTIQAGAVRAALKEGRAMLDALNLGASGERHRTLARALEYSGRYLDAVEERMGRLLETETLRDGIAIQRALDDTGLAGEMEIRQLSARDGETPARYRVEVADLGAIEGTVAQVVGILGRMEARP